MTDKPDRSRRRGDPRRRARGRRSRAREVADAFIAAGEQGAEALNAFLVETPDHAIAAAEAADAAIGRPARR